MDTGVPDWLIPWPGEAVLLRKGSLLSKLTWTLGELGDAAAAEPICMPITILGGVVIGARLWAIKPLTK